MKRVFEPSRKSLLDVVKANLSAANMSTYITRVLYIGKYVGSYEDLAASMESIVNTLKEDVPDVLISGMFLVYPQYYIHLLEAPEDIIYKHLKAFYEQQTEDCKLERSIFLPSSHHVHQRFFTDWFHMYTIPPTLLESVGSYELSEIKAQVSNCLTKVYVLCYKISNTIRDQSIAMAEVVRNMSHKIARDFPESTLVEYLLNADTPVLMSVEEYLNTYRSVPFINLYRGNGLLSLKREQWVRGWLALFVE